jgi:curved DNA-binding protein CbpA
MLDPYAVLGLDKNSSHEAIKQRYRQLIQKFHPDKNETESDETKADAKTQFDYIQKAWAILGDPEKRKLYDDTGYIEPERNDLTRSIISVLRPLILSYLARGEEIFTINIIDEITKHCLNQILAAKNKIDNYKKKKRYLTRVIKKFKKKNRLKKDFLTDIFLQELSALDNAINGQINIILIMTQAKSVINEYEFDFMKVIDGPPNSYTTQGVSLGNIFDLAGVTNSNGT